MRASKRQILPVVLLPTLGVLALALFFQKTLNLLPTFAADASLFSLRLPLRSRFPTPEPGEVPSDPACLSTYRLLPRITFFPGASQYADVRLSSWSAQASALWPSCVIQPRNVSELAAVVEHLGSLYQKEVSLKPVLNSANEIQHKLRFAVRSGGHAPDAGFSSISGGILIDISKFDAVVVDATKGVAHVGAGSRWGSVHQKLADQGLMAIGGRDADVGVGGFVLGGGISYLSPQYGMACDNIQSYEIVLADGTIATASNTTNQDLWRALQGGSGNFGIVTKITTRTFPVTKIWGGGLYWPAFHSGKIIQQLHEFAKPENFDPYAASPILVFICTRQLFGGSVGLRAVASNIMHTRPEVWPSVWQGFRTIWRYWSTVHIRTSISAGLELSGMSPPGQRRFHLTMTIKNNLETLNGLHAIHADTESILSHVKGLGHCLIFQPLTSTIINSGSSNVLGLNSRNDTESLIIILISQSWVLKSDDDVVQRTTWRMLQEMQDFASSKGTLDPYIYLNYAGEGQHVFESYGETNVKFLRDVSRRYDPTGFWQAAKQGGFKLGL